MSAEAREVTGAVRRTPPVAGAGRRHYAAQLSGRDRWLLPMVVLGICLAVAGFALNGAIRAMVMTWLGSQSYNHQFLIVPISLYLLWERRRDVAAAVPRPSAAGVLAILVAGAAWLTGRAANVAVIQQFATVGMVVAVVLAVLGRDATRRMTFPLAYLFLAVPAGDALVPWLQDVTAHMAVRALQIVGIPVYVDGYYLSTPGGDFKIAEACAGLHYLMASIALGVLFAQLMYRTWWRRILFLVLSVLVPIAANGARAFLIVLIADLTNGEVATGVDHIIYGWIFLTVVMLLLLALGMSFRERDEKREMVAGAMMAYGSAVRPGRMITAALICCISIIAAPAYALFLDNSTSAPQAVVVLPAPPAGWRLVAPGQETWRPTVVGADSEAVSTYEVGSARVLLHVAYYARQREGAEIISPANTLSDETSWRRIAAGPASVLLDGRAVSVRHARLRSATKNLIVWQWYWVDGRFTGNAYVAKALRAKVALIGGGREAAIVTVAVEYADGDATVADPVRTFVDKLAPFGAIFERAQPNN